MSHKKLIISLLITLFLVIFIGGVSLYKEEIYSINFKKDEYIANNEQQEQQTSGESQEKKNTHDHDKEDIIKLTNEQIKKIGLKFRQAGPGSLNLTLLTPAKVIIKPDRLAHIIPKVSGMAREANKNIGDFVRAGDLMAALESQDMADIKASYLAALSKQRLATSSLKREENLYREKVSPLQDYLSAKNAYEEATINVQLAKQKLRTFGLDNREIQQLTDQDDRDLRLYLVRTPIDGTVTMRHITQGEFIENTRTIYEVADLKTVWVEIGIYPKDLYSIKEGQLVEVLIPEKNITAKARLIYVSPIVAAETITATAVAELDNPEGLWRPGTFVKVNISTEKINAPLVVPKEAIQNSEGKDYVFVVTPEGFERRLVKLGQSDRDNAEILSGLNPGEEYVANRTFLLKAELGKSAAEHEH